MADFNDRPESVASLWRRWCDQAGMPHPSDDLLGKERGIAHGRLRFDMWDATFERATIHERLSAETAAAVCAKADSYLSGASTESDAFKKSCTGNRKDWLPKLKALAARFAAEAALEAADAAAAAAAVGELPPPSPLCLSLVGLPPPLHPLCPSLSRSLSSPSLPPSLPSLPFLRGRAGPPQCLNPQFKGDDYLTFVCPHARSSPQLLPGAPEAGAPTPKARAPTPAAKRLPPWKQPPPLLMSQHD